MDLVHDEGAAQPVTMAAGDGQPSSDDEMAESKAYANIQDSRKGQPGSLTVDGRAPHRWSGSLGSLIAV